MKQILQGNVPIRHLLNKATLLMSWRRSSIKEVKDCALNFSVECIFFTQIWSSKRDIFLERSFFFSSKTLTFLCRTLTFRSLMSIWSRRSPSSLDIRFFSCVAWRAWAVFFSMVLFLSSNLPRSSSTYVSNKVIIWTLSCYTYSFK